MMMIPLLADSLKRFGKALGSALFPVSGRRLRLHHLAVLLILIPAFLVLQAVHWIAFALDEVLFPGYRSVRVRRPVFVLGIPRSGTTFLHKVLSADSQYTTFSVWECLFAPSILERRIIRGLAAIDALVGAPLARVLNWVSSKVFSGLDDIHEMGLSEPEEDYLALLPVFACFIMIVPFPEAPSLWQVGAMDKDMEDAERERLQGFYHRLLQKHLYVHGREKTLLSKNAAFAGFASSLRKTFPDARFLVCLREPEKVVPSQLSSLQGGFQICGSLQDPAGFNDRMVDLLHRHYQNLSDEFATVSSSHHCYLRQSDLKDNLKETISSVYSQLGLNLTSEYQTSLAEQSEQSREHASRHVYTLADFGLSEERIHERFAAVCETLPLPPGPSWEAGEEERRQVQSEISNDSNAPSDRMTGKA